MSLEVSPLELDFRRPFNHEVSQTISLGNRTNSPVAFKVKTTTPKRYCVRPNSGRIEPGTEVQVQVLLQAMKEEPPLNQKCRDKFLVQAVSVPADKEFSNVSAIWQEADANRDSMKPFERKIKVAFLPALDEEQQQEHVKRGPPPLGDPPAYNANPVYESHIASNPLGIANTTPSTGAAPPPSSPPPPAAAAAATTTTPSSKHKPSFAAEARFDKAEPSTSPIGGAKRTSADSRSVHKYVDESPKAEVANLKNQLQEARSQIERLKDQLADQGLRQRRVPAEIARGDFEKSRSNHGGQGSLGDGATALLQASEEQGVQLNIVAVLCFISFLLGYLFF